MSDRQYPARQYFSLDITRKAPPVTAQPGILRVRRFRVSPRFDTRSLVYRTGDVQYDTDFYNEYLTDAGAMVSESARNWLLQGGSFATVVDSSSSLSEDFVLEGVIQNLSGDFRSSPRAEVSVQLFLISSSATNGGVVFQKLYNRSIALPEKSPRALVVGLGSGLSEIFTELETDIVSAASKKTQPH